MGDFQQEMREVDGSLLGAVVNRGADSTRQLMVPQVQYPGAGIREPWWGSRCIISSWITSVRLAISLGTMGAAREEVGYMFRHSAVR
jgi:hypothetical protein